MTRELTILAGVCLVAGVVAGSNLGCDPRALDKAVTKAPVKGIAIPDGFKGSDLGRILLPLAPPSGHPEITARLLAAASSGQPSIAIFDFDAAGKVTSHVLSDADLTLLHEWPVKSLTPLSDGSILLGVPEYGFRESPKSPPKGHLFVLKVSDDGTPFHPVITSGTENVTSMDLDFERFGRGVATLGEKILVLSSARVSLLETSKDLLLPSNTVGLATCPLGDYSTGVESFRAIVQAKTEQDVAAVVAVGVPGGVHGKVVFVRSLQDCTTAIEGQESGFGTSLAVARSSGGKSLLVVGAPSNAVHVYKLPYVKDDPPLVSFHSPIVGDLDTGNFGQRVAAVDLVDFIGNAGADEIIVAAPDLAGGSEAAAGRVYIYGSNDGGQTWAQIDPLEGIADFSPSSHSSLGISLTGLAFTPPDTDAICSDDGKPRSKTNLLVAAEIKTIFTYFKFPGSLPDPRCFDGPPKK